MAGAREVWRVRKWTEKDRGEAGNIDLLGQRQVTPRWEDDPVQRYIGRQWRACWGRRGLPPPWKDIMQSEGRVGRDKYTYVSINNIY